MNPKKNGKISPSPSHSVDGLKDMDSINKIIHQPVRLQILSILSVVKRVDMLYLKQQLEVTWGNLSTHISKLEDAGYLQVTKKIIEKKSYTTLQITVSGRDEFETYRKTMKTILNFS